MTRSSALSFSKGSPTIGLSFRSLVIFCIFLLVVNSKLERLVPGSEAADDL